MMVPLYNTNGGEYIEITLPILLWTSAKLEMVQKRLPKRILCHYYRSMLRLNEKVFMLVLSCSRIQGMLSLVHNVTGS
jgi:hypothetical protein